MSWNPNITDLFHKPTTPNPKLKATSTKTLNNPSSHSRVFEGTQKTARAILDNKNLRSQIDTDGNGELSSQELHKFKQDFVGNRKGTYDNYANTGITTVGLDTLGRILAEKKKDSWTENALTNLTQAKDYNSFSNSEKPFGETLQIKWNPSQGLEEGRDYTPFLVSEPDTQCKEKKTSLGDSQTSSLWGESSRPDPWTNPNQTSVKKNDIW